MANQQQLVNEADVLLERNQDGSGREARPEAHTDAERGVE